MNREKLPFITTIVSSVSKELGVPFHIEDDDGYLFSLVFGGRKNFCGTGSISSYAINSTTAASLARDKFFTHKIAIATGIPTIESKLFFLSSFYSSARGAGRELADLYSESKTFDYPIFAKPNKGSRGDYAEIVQTHADLLDYITRASKKHEQILIQPYIAGAESRVFVVDDKCYFQYCRDPVTVKGDGVATWSEVLKAYNLKLHRVGLSEIPKKNFEADLERARFGMNDISPFEQTIQMSGRRNISATNSPHQFSTEVPYHLAVAAVKITKILGLRVSGVDFLIPISNSANQTPTPILLEVNANPSIDSLEQISEIDLAKQIWRNILQKWINMSPK